MSPPSSTPFTLSASLATSSDLAGPSAAAVPAHRAPGSAGLCVHWLLIDAGIPHSLLLEIYSDVGIGTEIVP